jgi:hypothetical protein
MFEGIGATPLGGGDAVVAVVRMHWIFLPTTCFAARRRASAIVVGFDGVLVKQVAFDGAVHLGEAGVTVGFGARDQRAGVVGLALSSW